MEIKILYTKRYILFIYRYRYYNLVLSLIDIESPTHIFQAKVCTTHAMDEIFVSGL